MARKKIRRSNELDGDHHLVEFGLRDHVRRCYHAHRKATKCERDSDAYLNAALSGYIGRHGIPEKGEEIGKHQVCMWLKPDTLKQIERVAWWMGLDEAEAIEKVMEGFLAKNGYSVREEIPV